MPNFVPLTDSARQAFEELEAIQFHLCSCDQFSDYIRSELARCYRCIQLEEWEEKYSKIVEPYRIEK